MKCPCITGSEAGRREGPPAAAAESGPPAPAATCFS